MSNRVMKESGIEWIGEIQENWKVLKGKHIFKLQNGYAFKSELFDNTDGFPLIRIRDITSGEIKTFYKGEVLDDYIVTSGDVLIGMDGDFNVRIWNNQDALLNQRCCRLTEYDNFNKNFIAYACPYPLKVINDTVHATTVKHLSTTDLFNSDFAIPPLHEQQAIATYLDEQVSRLDQLIEDQQQVIEDWKSYKQSLITETVTKGLNPEVEMKNSGIEWIGEIPSHWEVKRLRNLGTTKSGLSNKTKEDFGFGNPFINYGDVYKKDIIHATGLVDSTNDEIIKFSIKRGDVLFTGSSETIQELGMSSVALEDVEDSTYSGFLIRFKPYPGQLHPEFSRFLFRSAAMREFLIRDDNSVTRSNLSQKKLKNMPVIIPPLHEQQAIADFLDEKCLKIDQLIEDKQRLIEDLKAYKQSLIYECVTGKKEIV